MRAKRMRAALAIAGTTLVTGCATVPIGPTWPAYPGSRATAQQFHVDDATCRSQAHAYFGPAPTQPANNAAAANVVGGTLLGAAIGTLFGAAGGDAGVGAAIGAGTGLLGGSLVAADMSGYSSAQMQIVYDRVYSQCMYALGHLVPAPALAYRQYRGYPVPSGVAPRVGYPPASAPPPSRSYPPPTTIAPPAGFPPSDTPPPSAAPRG
jgi:hypothetical protein